jgi:hypothetical protein
MMLLAPLAGINRSDNELVLMRLKKMVRQFRFFQFQNLSEKLSMISRFAVNRDDYKLVQTPQCFQTPILQHAYQQHYSHLFTDDASVVEADGVKITLVNGNRENIKITTPHDLKLSGIIFEVVFFNHREPRSFITELKGVEFISKALL